MVSKLNGLIAAPFTPMLAGGSLNLTVINDYYQLLKRNKVNGAFIAGSTGEGVSMTLEEKFQLIDAWAAATAADPEFHVIVLAGGTCIQDAAAVAARAEQAGIYGIALTAPFYFKPANAQVLAEICRQVAAAAPNTAFYYYHIPVLTGCYIPMYDLLKAVNGTIDNFCGIKYTHEDFMDFQSCMHVENGRYNMLWGRDENMLSSLPLGTKAAIGSTYNYAAPLYLDLMEAYRSGDVQKAETLQQLSIDMIRLLGKYGGIATGKAFMKLVGMDLGGFRLPVSNMSPEAFEAFKKDVAALDFESFRSK
jgi:N-acetylneuraminate lyase